MKQLLLLISGTFFLTSFSFAQQKNLFQIDSTLNITSIFKKDKPINLGVFGKTKETANHFFNPNMKNFSEFNFKDFENISKTKEENKFNSQMPLIEPKGNCLIRVLPMDTTKNYSLRVIKPNLKHRFN